MAKPKRAGIKKTDAMLPPPSDTILMVCDRLIGTLKHIPCTDDEETEALIGLVREITEASITRATIDSNKATELWMKLYLEFAGAYNRAVILGTTITHTPEDEEIIHSIYACAGWCLLEVTAPEIYSAVIVCFFESLGVNRYARDEIKRYMTPDVFVVLQETGVLRYICKPDEEERFVADYWSVNSRPSSVKAYQSIGLI
jgi:hypothetical protein